ncbi:sugar-transfer associated ATP-grasp domain-containing protein [Asticcacaulis sp.]|uniref:sugar-transfer associated ATP-grasp domain-containing protein n=1 Tax=Asticcacaulis sp. TaxID=1872648 RepID=UPI002611EB32|nr:sugar-transfer associated ATP-grasp domain-containing protein [Asticcacaulis sp.]
MAPLLRLFLVCADRSVWAAAAAARTSAFARANELNAIDATLLFGDCLLSGATPVEAWVWRGVFGGRHPLPARAAGLLLSRLGDAAGHRLLGDKAAAAEHLARAGVAVPVLRAMICRGDAPDEASILASGAAAGLFVKPRRGSGGRAAFSLVREDDGWRVNGGSPTDWLGLRSRLLRMAATDDLLVQERLTTRFDLADLAEAGRAPVLRLTSARAPGQLPFLHSALLNIPVPGRDSRHFLHGEIHAPINPIDGRMACGVSFARSQERLEALPWNGALMAVREISGFFDAVAMAWVAASVIPPMPLVNWDFILTDDGPVLLEGNSAGNWILTNLAGRYDLDAGSLGALLAAWAA